MTKRFCDLCEKPASELTAREIETTYGKIYTPSTLADSFGFRENPRQAKIVCRVSFSIRDHPTGFGGPPDLCTACQRELISRL